MSTAPSVSRSSPSALEAQRRRMGELAAALHNTAGLAAQGYTEACLELPSVLRTFSAALDAHAPREHAWMRRRGVRDATTLRAALRWLQAGCEEHVAGRSGWPNLAWAAMRLATGWYTYEAAARSARVCKSRERGRARAPADRAA